MSRRLAWPAKSWPSPPSWRGGLIFILLAAALYLPVSALTFKGGVYAAAWLEHLFVAPAVPLDTLLYVRSSGQGYFPSPLGYVTARVTNLLAVSGLLLVLAPLLAAVYRKPLLGWITSAQAFRWRLVVAGFVGTGLLCALGAGLVWLLSPSTFTPPFNMGAAPPVAVAATLVAVAAMLAIPMFFEELAFRGWALQQGMAVFGNRTLVLLLSAAVFTAAHRSPGVVANLILFAGGVGFGVAALRLGGLELAWGAHWAVNLVQMFLAPQAALPSGHFSGLDAITTGGAHLLIVSSMGLSPILVAEAAARWSWLHSRDRPGPAPANGERCA